MKLFLRTTLIHLTTLYLTNLIFAGFHIQTNPSTLISAAIVFVILNKLVKPVIKLLLLPINLITLGLFSWLVNVITLFLLQITVPGITIKSFIFSGINLYGFTAPAMEISTFFSYLLSSIIIWAIINLIKWLFI